jgi:hypothetical protein
MNPWQNIDGPLASYRQVPAESLFSKSMKNWRLLVVIEMVVSLFFGCAAVIKPLDTEIISPTESPEAHVEL